MVCNKRVMALTYKDVLKEKKTRYLTNQWGRNMPKKKNGRQFTKHNLPIKRQIHSSPLIINECVRFYLCPPKLCPFDKMIIPVWMKYAKV